MDQQSNRFPVLLGTNTKFIFSTSGSGSSILKKNETLNKLGLDFAYFTFSEAISPKEYADLLRSPITLGGAVTAQKGLKSTIIPYLDEVDTLALKTQAVNTVVNNQGRLLGYNTDARGLEVALKMGIDQVPGGVKTAVIYGNGGVSGVAYHVLREMGIEVEFKGRNEARVLEKKKALGIENEPFPSGPYDLLVDATPISSSKNFMEIAPGFQELLENSSLVFCHNMPEKDGKNNYLKQYCEENDKVFVGGDKMYVPQLIEQYKLFFSAIADDQARDLTEEKIIDALVL